jgi:hypothetical protein
MDTKKEILENILWYLERLEEYYFEMTNEYNFMKKEWKLISIYFDKLEHNIDIDEDLIYFIDIYDKIKKLYDNVKKNNLNINEIIEISNIII